jgi:zinc transporter, ZIP family
VVGIFITLPRGIVAAILAFGSGVLVASLTFSLTEEAFEMTNDVVPIIIGFVFGGISYTIANYILTERFVGTLRHSYFYLKFS